MTKIDIAYCAGLIDGEGYIGIKRDRGYACQERKTPGYHARIQVRMVDEPAIQFLAESFGGTYYREKPHANKGRPLYCWQASDKNAEQTLRALLPYLKVKRRSAEAVLELRALQADGRSHRTKVTGTRAFPNKYGTVRIVESKCFSDEYVARCQELWERCKSLNATGIY